MRVIGLTGPTGAGKGLIAARFTELGAEVIDCDALYHGLLERSLPLQRELESAFPGCVRDGTVDRHALASIVFSDREALTQLETIAYRHITQAIRKAITLAQRQGKDILVLDAPTLFESGADALCSVTVAVIAPKALRLERIMIRDGIPADAALARMGNQHDEAWFQVHCNHTIINAGDPASAREQTDRIWTLINDSI